MRLRSSSSVALVVCLLAATCHCSRVVAQDEAGGSTIRLISATEPVGDDSSNGVPEAEAIADAPEPPKNLGSRETSAPATPTNSAVPITAQPPTATQTKNRPWTPVGVYTSPSAHNTLSQLPRPAQVQPTPRLPESRRRGKPFQGFQTEPAISPYLSLYQTEANGNNLPNYFAFVVRPQMQQIEANRMQQQEIQQLRGQLQKISSTVAVPQQSAGMPSHARYMDTAQFYRGLQR